LATGKTSTNKIDSLKNGKERLKTWQKVRKNISKEQIKTLKDHVEKTRDE
jgi:hypothetical protein